MKALGDYTSQVHELVQPGMPAVIGPPHGHFDRSRGTNRQIWIAGGIGVTPFLSWLRSLDRPLDQRVDLFYSTDHASPFGDEILHVAEANDSLRVHLIDTSVSGLLTTDQDPGPCRRAPRHSVGLHVRPGNRCCTRSMTGSRRLGSVADTSTASTSTGADPRTRSPVQDRQATIVSATDHLDVKNPDLGRIPRAGPVDRSQVDPGRTGHRHLRRSKGSRRTWKLAKTRAMRGPHRVRCSCTLLWSGTAPRFTRQDGVCGDVAGHAALARCATTRRRVPARFLGPAEADELTAEYDGRHGPWVAS